MEGEPTKKYEGNINEETRKKLVESLKELEETPNESEKRFICQKLRTLISRLTKANLLELRDRAVPLLKKLTFDQVKGKLELYLNGKNELGDLVNGITHSPAHDAVALSEIRRNKDGWITTPLDHFVTELVKMLAIIQEKQRHYINALGFYEMLEDEEKIRQLEVLGDTRDTNRDPDCEEVTQNAVVNFIENVKDDPEIQLDPEKEIEEIKVELKKIIGNI